jgi:hypothetical protein
LPVLVPFAGTNGDVRVRVHEAGEQRRVPDIEDLVRFRRELTFGADANEAAILDEQRVPAPVPDPRAVHDPPSAHQYSHDVSSFWVAAGPLRVVLRAASA